MTVRSPAAPTLEGTILTIRPIAMFFTSLVVLWGCNPTESEYQMTMQVVTLNTRQMESGEAERDYARRLWRIARVVNTETLWGIIGLQELGTRIVYSGIPGFSYYTRRAVDVDCFRSPTLVNVKSVHCFNGGLANAAGSADQVGELGLVWRDVLYEQVNGQLFSTHIGDQAAGAQWKHLLGARFRVKASGHVVPVFSVHITSNDDHDLRRSQIDGLIDAIHEFWQPGDLTPLVLGDFNFHKWRQEDKDRMLEDFVDANEAIGRGGTIDRVYVGRKSAFVGAAGALEITGGERVDSVLADNLTDHRAVFINLGLPRD